MKSYSKNQRIQNEINHFSNLEHVWWGAKTYAGQKRYDNKLNKLKEFCQPKKNYKILEIGCGDGEFTKRLAKLNCQIFAIDITAKVIARGKKNLRNENIKFMIDNAEKMSFKDNLFDIVCGVSILHHVDPQKSLQEGLRVLKPGGQIFFTEPNLLNPHIWAGLHIKLLREAMEFSPDETALTRWDIEKVLKKIGFCEIEVLNYDFLHPKTPQIFVKPIEKLSSFLERMPLIKEISGSLIVWARK